MAKVVQKLHPEINKVYFINTYTLLRILSGSGTIQFDFKNYDDWQDKAIYLEKGQYIKFFSEDFVVQKIEFPSKTIFEKKEVRVLFKHLISLGYVDFNECDACKRYLENTVFSGHTSEIIDISSEQWYWQNPFKASKQEYQIIFDVKDIIDENYYGNFNNDDLSQLMTERGYEAQALVKDKIGLSIKNLISNKKLMEGKKKIVFSDKSIQEVSYETGFKDPAYFNRVFKRTTGMTPSDFRNDFDYENRDTFVRNLMELLKTFHTQQRTLGFYADKINLSVKALSKKTRAKMNASLGQLIRNELVSTSKKMLEQDAPIKEIAFALGFEEPQHFTHFFKNHTGTTPSAYRLEKYNP